MPAILATTESAIVVRPCWVTSAELLALPVLV
jgi:hypothetical protein